MAQVSGRPVQSKTAETRVPLDVHYAAAPSVAGSSETELHEKEGSDSTTNERIFLAENIEQSSAQDPILNDELATPRYLIAAALSLFAQRGTDTTDVAEPSSLPITRNVEPFADADRTLGRAFSMQLVDLDQDQLLRDTMQPATIDAICMLQVVCNAFKLRQSSVLNALYILELASDCGILLINTNYRSLLLIALLVTVKEYKECAVHIADLRSLFPSLNLSCLSQLEPFLLSTIDYRISTLSGHMQREHVALRLQRVRTTEKMLASTSRAGFVFCRKLIIWTRKYVDDIFQGTLPGVHARQEQLVNL
uniref:Cyclin N-terminal domain-containing protein n=1 Tax=Chrysotila carterae TaxID=13221 RepID=A0A7S4FC98_CHRCT|mmetsp:Transcript_9995/g.21333  ORF Transcript_9995/g.21333 Transcript_9995/m.21333 type:complete len:308 (+) Transcript_9995:346-1269(+)